MTMWGVFPSTDGVTNTKPAAMFKTKIEAESWGMENIGSFVIKELEITRCDVVERTGLVGR